MAGAQREWQESNRGREGGLGGGVCHEIVCCLLRFYLECRMFATAVLCVRLIHVESRSGERRVEVSSGSLQNCNAWLYCCSVLVLNMLSPFY